MCSARAYGARRMMPLETRLRSTAMRVLSSPLTAALARTRARVRRRLTGAPRVVHYFHQVDDPYSHLTVQKLALLQRTYAIPFVPHLVRPPTASFRGDATRFTTLALRDAASIAAWFGARLPDGSVQPDERAVARANALLAVALPQDAAAPAMQDAVCAFAVRACEVGDALWSGATLADGEGRDAAGALDQGTQLRDRLGHYFGAMFHFEGEWYWGVDRLHLLEQRLRDEGFAPQGTPPCVPLPQLHAEGIDAGAVTLEYFPSLRSPYTAVGHARVLELVRRTGVTFVLRPVMPMMMRGVPAPLPKQRYIAFDAAREARFHREPYGRMVDPFGEPVRKAFALYPAATRMGRGLEYVTAYLEASWAKGVDITSDAGLQRVVADAGLDWAALRREAAGDDWQAVLEDNVSAMLGAGLWGVPSFRVSGGNDETAFACWGQDRLWRVEAEIARRAHSTRR